MNSTISNPIKLALACTAWLLLGLLLGYGVANNKVEEPVNLHNEIEYYEGVNDGCILIHRDLFSTDMGDSIRRCGNYTVFLRRENIHGKSHPRKPEYDLYWKQEDLSITHIH